MFTGLIQDLGYVHAKVDYQLQIRCPSPDSPILRDIEIGDSVAVDGACLTVERVLPQGFAVSVSPETLQRTTLGARSPQDPVNLETSLRVGSKIGGHFVTGHVDGSAKLSSSQATATSWELAFYNISDFVRPYIVPKGSITVNGVSLTIASCHEWGEWFTVAVIPLTYELTNLHCLAPDSLVNLEGDILGKYVQRLLKSPVSDSAASALPAIDTGFLAEHGYL